MSDYQIEFTMKTNFIKAFCIQILLFGTLTMVNGQTGVYTLNGGSDTQTGQTFAATLTDESSVYVLDSGVLTLNSCVLTKTGNTSDINASSQYGLNAGLLVKSAGKVTITGTTITTNASGANGIFATGTNSTIVMTGGFISASGSGAHGVDVTYGGIITTNNVDITTNDDNSSAIATDFGGGTVTINGGTIITTSTVAGSHSAGIYSTGVITVNDASVTSSADAGGVIDGANSIILNNTALTGNTQGIKIHVTAPSTGDATVTMSGGGLNVTNGDAFYFDGSSGNTAKGTVTVREDATISASTGCLVNAVSPATANFTVQNSDLAGNIISTGSSTLNVSLLESASLTCAINNSNTATLVTLTMDCSSTWTVTANSHINGLITNPCISGTSVSNITGNGNNVYYTTFANPSLNGLAYSLVSGGYLLPEGSSSINLIENNIFDLTISPNPFEDVLNITIDLENKSDLNCAITDITGKTVYQVVFTGQPSGSNKLAINLSDKLPQGTYLFQVRVSSSNGSYRLCKKIIHPAHAQYTY